MNIFNFSYAGAGIDTTLHEIAGAWPGVDAVDNWHLDNSAGNQTNKLTFFIFIMFPGRQYGDVTENP